MFYNNIDPTLFHLGPFEIRYYGIIFAAGFVIAYFLIAYLSKQRKLNLTKEDVADLVFYLVIGVILGARVFYILVYNLNHYMANPLEIFALWQGGLSFHGGLIGAVISTYIFCRNKKIEFYDVADIAVMPLAIGLFFGRIGNFINGELYGRITDVPWAVKFKDADGFRHPSQIYESLKNLFIFAALWKIKDKKLPKGFLFWLFVLMYSALRFFIEFFRQPDEQLGFVLFNLSMGQLLSMIMFAVGVFFMYRVSRR